MAREYWRPGNMLYPVPAVMVSCGRKDETPNSITIAWTGSVCSEPAMLYISVRKERYSYPILKETGEFVVNLVTADLVKSADYCGVKSGRDVDKFQVCGLTAVASQKVTAPTIAESPLALECKVKQIIELGTHDMFLAEVSAVSVDEQYLDKNGKFHLNKTGLCTYSHGEYYTLGDKIGKFGYSVRKKPAAKRRK